MPLFKNVEGFLKHSQVFNYFNDLKNGLQLMFRNCRKFNEVGSLIYDDAVKLEKILMNKVKELGPLETPKSDKKIPKT